MSESTADAALRWREKELRAAWEMGRDAALDVVFDEPICEHGYSFEQAEHRDCRMIHAIEKKRPPADLGDLVKEKAHD